MSEVSFSKSNDNTLGFRENELVVNMTQQEFSVINEELSEDSEFRSGKPYTGASIDKILQMMNHSNSDTTVFTLDQCQKILENKMSDDTMKLIKKVYLKFDSPHLFIFPLFSNTDLKKQNSVRIKDLSNTSATGHFALLVLSNKTKKCTTSIHLAKKMNFSRSLLYKIFLRLFLKISVIMQILGVIILLRPNSRKPIAVHLF